MVSTTHPDNKPAPPHPVSTNTLRLLHNSENKFLFAIATQKL
jgi:hypothetical protein